MWDRVWPQKGGIWGGTQDPRRHVDKTRHLRTSSRAFFTIFWETNKRLLAAQSWNDFSFSLVLYHFWASLLPFSFPPLNSHLSCSSSSTRSHFFFLFLPLRLFIRITQNALQRCCEGYLPLSPHLSASQLDTLHYFLCVKRPIREFISGFKKPPRHDG